MSIPSKDKAQPQKSNNYIEEQAHRDNTDPFPFQSGQGKYLTYKKLNYNKNFYNLYTTFRFTEVALLLK